MNAIRASHGGSISWTHIARVFLISLITIALASGATLRFYAIGEHSFWGDENVTALHVAGNTGRDVVNAADSAEPISARAVKRFSRIGPSSSVSAVVNALRAEDSQHPPVYYVLAYAWSRVAGSGPVQLRTFSALLSLLLIPAMYWFAVELFGSRRIAFIAAALASVSPFCIEYAQQAREYGFWAVLACTACAALLRALRTGRGIWWSTYGATIAIGLYTHIFTLLILFAHILYVGGVRRTVDRTSVIRFCIAASAALVLFVPWGVLLVYGYVHHVSYGGVGFGTGTTSQALHAGLYPWMVGMTSPFVDLQFLNLWYFGVVAVVALLEAIAVVVLVRRTPFVQWWLPVSLLAATALLQVKPVLVDMPRYMVPAILAVQMAVAFLIGTARPRMAAAAIGLLAAIVAFDLGDDLVRASMPIWWTQEANRKSCSA